MTRGERQNKIWKYFLKRVRMPFCHPSVALILLTSLNTAAEKNCSDVSLQAEDRRSPACDEGRRGVALAVAGCFFLQKQTLLTEFFSALSEGFLCVEFHLQCECFVCLHTALHRKYPSVAGDERNGRRETWFCLRKKSLLLSEVPC